MRDALSFPHKDDNFQPDCAFSTSYFSFFGVCDDLKKHTARGSSNFLATLFGVDLHPI